MSTDIELFIEHYSTEIRNNNAAIFAGAGLSVETGFVDWKSLLRDAARELELDVDKEDLISVAQFHKNKYGRGYLNQQLVDNFCKGHSKTTEKHEILARLPINTFWTTNYDDLIEEALRKSGKVVDVKYTVQQLTTTVAKRDAVVYKMHGDKNHPDDCILTKDDYESYPITREAYINGLTGDLVSKTFLFLGFSFTDPNLDYVLSRIRTMYKGQRRHYCFFKEIAQEPGETQDKFEYRVRKQGYLINDLARFHVKTILIKSYQEITDILRQIELLYKRKTVFISGSAIEYGTWGESKSGQFLKDLSAGLIKAGFRIISGFGLGVGSYVISGSLDQIYLNEKRHLKDDLVLRPFPQDDQGKNMWPTYRQDMISYAGIAVFVFGNKLDKGATVLAAGVRAEYEIAKSQSVILIPVGATGYIARELWKDVESDFDKYFPDDNGSKKAAFNSINDENQPIDDIVKNILILTTSP